MMHIEDNNVQNLVPKKEAAQKKVVFKDFLTRGITTEKRSYASKRRGKT